MKIWMDIINTSQVNVLMPFYKHLKQKGCNVIVTSRVFSETIPLLNKYGINPIIIGKHQGKNKIKKVIGMFWRLVTLLFCVPKFDIALSAAGTYTGVIATLRGKKSISFQDNDLAMHQFTVFLFSSHLIFPSYFRYEEIIKKYHINRNKIHLFKGFKEDIYIGDFQVDDCFLEQIPFTNFITIRPENLKAAYIPKNSISIVPELFKVFKDRNILFLPRYEEEKKYAEGYSNVWYPENPLIGLDVCYYSTAVLTGAGTFAREAALLGVPAVSFFPGHDFLTVDKVMQERGLEFKSRDVLQIKHYIDNAQKHDVSFDNSRRVLKEVLDIVDNIINDIIK